MKTTASFKISEKVWLYPGKAGWYFVTIKKEDSEEIKQDFMWPRRGFGAIPVMVTIGKTSWKTSIFPEKAGTYLLPLKKAVRVKEEIKEGDRILITLKVLN
jgi:hypothetical protein